MRDFLQHLYHWPFNHTVQFALLLFVLGCLASVFSQDIRAFLSLPPQKLNIWILKSRLVGAKSTLVHLQNCRASTSQLIIFVTMFFSSGMYFFICATVMAFLRPLMPPSQQTSPLYLMIVLVFFISLFEFWYLMAFIKKLWKVETESEKLQRRIIFLIDKLAAKGIDTAALLKSVEDSQAAK
jgi:hypothetical protein